MADGLITTLDEFEAAYREGLGVPLTPKPWRTVSEEWVQRFSEGVGDYNPLYRDSEYAAAGRFHGLVASPAFLFSINFGATASMYGHLAPSSIPMSALTILYGGVRIEWHRPIWVGDRVRAVETPVDVQRKKLRQIDDALICTGRTEYFNQRGEKIATLHNDMFRFANQKRGVEAAQAAQDGQIAPDPLVWARTRRGAKPLLGSSVTAGEEIPELLKGTYTRTELYLFALAALTPKRAPAVDEGTIDVGAGGRADPEYAKKARAQAGTFDFGPQRVCWLIQAVTDWMGDHGDLLELSARLHRPNLVGDTNRVRGRVEEITREDERWVATVSTEVVNQADVVTASARMKVRLPAEMPVDDTAIVFTRDVDKSHGLYG